MICRAPVSLLIYEGRHFLVCLVIFRKHATVFPQPRNLHGVIDAVIFIYFFVFFFPSKSFFVYVQSRNYVLSRKYRVCYSTPVRLEREKLMTKIGMGTMQALYSLQRACAKPFDLS